MADKIVSLEFNVKTASAVTEINKVTKATEGATTATNNFENQLEDIKKATDGGGFKDLSRAIKQYQDIALQAGETSPIGRQALAEAGELKDRLGDLKDAIRTTGQDGLGLQASLQLGGGIVAGFGAVQGVMALVGSESEDLQKTLVKLQAVQATLASVEEIRAVLQKESAFMITATTIAEKARAAATAVSTFVTNGATLSLKLFRGALIGTGIGAIVVLLIAAADAMGLFGDSTDKATLSAEGLNKELDKQNELTKRLNTQIDRNLEKQVLKAKIAGQSEEQISKLQIDAQNLRTKNLEDFALKTLRIESLIVKNTKSTEEEKIEAKKKTLEAYRAVDDAIQKQSVLNLSNQLILADKAREAEKEKAKAAADELKRKNDERRALEKQLAAELIADKDKRAKDEKLAAEKELADMQKRSLESADLFAAELAAQAATRKTYKEEELAEEIRIRDAKIQIANDLQSTLTNLGNLIINDSAKAVKFNKAMALIQIGIDTATALSKALSVTQSPSPDNVATGGLAGVAKYAGIAAMIFANAAKAKQILSSGNAAGSPPTMGGGGGSPTQMMQTQAPQTPGRVSNLTGSQTTTVKAIVVESDITTTQKRINSIQELAKI